MTSTYTYSLLEVPKDMFEEIRKRLAAGGVTFKDGEPLDMHGIALVAEKSDAEGK